MRRFFVAFLFLCLGVFIGPSGCSRPTSQKMFRIGVDPSFFPVALSGIQSRVFAFTNELLQEIAKKKKVQLVRKTFSWDNLVEGLRMDQCDAILSSIPENIVTQNKYSFSTTYLQTGVVLIVQKESMKTRLKDIKGKMVAIGKTDTQIELTAKYPELRTTFYTDLVPTLESVAGGWYEGCLVPVLQATLYTKDLFPNLSISRDGILTNEGIRLLTLKDCHPELITLFNAGLDELIRSGEYDALLKKWNLGTHWYKN